MTTIIETSSAQAPAASPLGRILNVTRLHLTNVNGLLILPWVILGFIFLVNLMIWWILFSALNGEDHADAVEGMQFSGASMFIFVYMLVVAVQAINLTFPFALGFSVTRRDFYLGSSLVFVLLSLVYAAGLTILAEVEKLTGGWGLGGSMFTVMYFGADDWLQRFTLFFLAFLFFFFIGAATAAVYVRWRSNGMLAFFAILTLILVGLAALATSTGSWPAVGNWFVANGPIGVAAWSLIPTALSAIAGFFLIRKATPKN